MVEIPNRLPTFIKQGGILGIPALLTNQTCTRDNPGIIPVTLYDNTADYASGNGAIVENVIIGATGTVTKSTLFFFVRLDDNTTWRYFAEVDLPAIGSASASAKDSNYPLRADLGRRIYSPVAQVGNDQGLIGFRINGNSRTVQLGCALGTAIGSLPIIVWLNGGEL